MTETLNALSMITKAGVPANKIVVGVTGYGRSFQMTTPGCTGPTCTYTGPESGATKGRCTGTAGYISNAEIRDILDTNPTAKKIFDSATQTDILVYNETQWVGYMSDNNKIARKQRFKALNVSPPPRIFLVVCLTKNTSFLGQPTGPSALTT